MCCQDSLLMSDKHLDYNLHDVQNSGREITLQQLHCLSCITLLTLYLIAQRAAHVSRGCIFCVSPYPLKGGFAFSNAER